MSHGKFVSILLILIIFVPGLVSCTNNETAIEQIDAEASVTVDDNINTTAKGIPSPEIEAVDYKEYVFKVLGRKTDTLNILFDEIYSESLNGEVINDAIYQRNDIVGNKYNIIIVSVIDDLSKFTNSVMAGDNAYDSAIPGVVSAFGWGMSGYLSEIKSLPHIDHEKPWWNSNSIKQTSVAGKNYFILGSINLLSYESVGVMFFNKKLIEEYKLENPYQLVRDNKWTFDKMIELCMNVGSDLDGDGKYGAEDIYGIAVNSYAALTITYGAGTNFAPKGEDNLPVHTVTEEFITYFQKVVETITNNTAVMYGERYGAERVNVMQKAFQEDRLLFLNEMLNRTSLLRSMETDYGILPMPLGKESQEEYSSFVHQGNSTSMVIPSNALDLDRTGRILEDLAYNSYIYAIPAYIDTAVKGKYLRDNESAEMVDIIIDSINFDITLLSNSPLMNDLRSMLNAGNTTVASAVTANEGKYKSKIGDVIKAFTE